MEADKWGTRIGRAGLKIIWTEFSTSDFAADTIRLQNFRPGKAPGEDSGRAVRYTRMSRKNAKKSMGTN